MKYSVIGLFVAILTAISSGAGAQVSGHHARHDMILYGQGELFASHAVYRPPHNYQVILRIHPGSQLAELYRQASARFPGRLVFSLDAMDISTIQTVDQVTGTLYGSLSNGPRTEVSRGVTLSRGEFDVIYFAEIPYPGAISSSQLRAHGPMTRVQ